MAREPIQRQVQAPTDKIESMQGARGWMRGLLYSFGYAFAGIYSMLRHQRNAQIHALITTLVVIFGILLQIHAGEWIMLVLCVALVLALEAMNTALEAVVDLASPQYHPLAKQAKDIAAGAVLITAIGAAIVGCIVFLPKLAALF